MITAADIPAVSGARSAWRDVEVRDSRFGSFEADDASWRGIRFTRCKLGYVNLRAAELLDIAFVDCTIAEIDLMDAAARRVAFEASRIATLNASGARLTDVDLRGADIAQAVGLEGLRGAIHLARAAAALWRLSPTSPGTSAGIRVDGPTAVAGRHPRPGRSRLPPSLSEARYAVLEASSRVEAQRRNAPPRRSWPQRPETLPKSRAIGASTSGRRRSTRPR